MARLTVIIPARNAAAVLGEQLSAVAGHGFPVIVVDNGSEDETAEIARAHGVTVVSEKRPGRHHACNAGVRACASEHLVFLDGDDRAEDGFLSAMADALADAPFVAGRLVPWPGFRDVHAQPVDGLPNRNGRPFVSGAAMGVWRSAFEEAGGFEAAVAYAEDVDLSWRLIELGYHPRVARDAKVRYRPRATTIETFRQHVNYGRGDVRLYLGWRDRGMTRRSNTDVLRELWLLLKMLRHLRSRRGRFNWARRSGVLVGHVAGSITARTWYL